MSVFLFFLRTGAVGAGIGEAASEYVSASCDFCVQAPEDQIQDITQESKDE